MESATFSYSRFFAAMQLGLSPVFLAFSIALISAGVHMALDSPDNAFIGLGATAAGLWIAVIMWQWVRYRHSLREKYTLDSKGVVVESPSATTKLLWSDFERAEYLIVPGMLRLESKALTKPVFLFLDGRGQKINERNRFVQRLVSSHMGDRFRKTWAL